MQRREKPNHNVRRFRKIKNLEILSIMSVFLIATKLLPLVEESLNLIYEYFRKSYCFYHNIPTVLLKVTKLSKNTFSL